MHVIDCVVAVAGFLLALLSAIGLSLLFAIRRLLAPVEKVGLLRCPRKRFCTLCADLSSVLASCRRLALDSTLPDPDEATEQRRLRPPVTHGV